MTYEYQESVQIEMPIESLIAIASPYPLRRYLKIEQDNYPINPREDWDNLWTLVYKSDRYYLGDKQAKYYDVLEVIADELGIEYDDNTSHETLVNRIKKRALIVSYYAYIHSDVRIFLDGNFATCQWDSGQAGYAYASFEDIRKWFGKKRLTSEIKDMAYKNLEGEIDTFDAYLQGAVYCYTIIDLDSGEEVDSCGGYYGYDHKESGLMESALESNNNKPFVFVVDVGESEYDYLSEYEEIED
jgi:hypothetical protein